MRDKLGIFRRFQARGFWLKSAATLGAGLLALIALDLLFPPPIQKARSGSLIVTDTNGIPLRAFPTEDGRWRLRADVARIDPLFVKALIEVEDERFYRHWGVDGLAVVRASGQAISNGRIVSGASTITMQTARLLEPRPRNLGSKLIEMIRAVQLERRLSKDEILELYLSLTPYGGNLEGIRAASWAYFGREPDRLTDDQIALLLALPQSPEVRRPDLKPDNAIAARARLLDRLVELELIPSDRAEEAKTLDLPGRNAFPAHAWHAAEHIRAIALDDATDRSGMPIKDVRSTLDAGLQKALESYLEDSARQLGGSVQFSAIVIETETRAVKAMVGSADRNRPGGWIDLTAAPRSPGSTLKPFIYGLAFDDGQALPNTFIEDLPARFNTYRPENFDRSFRGQVRVADALQHSLNVPAVLALERIGPERFASSLELAGVPLRVYGSASRDPGLALALGGVGMTLQDLGLLYSGLGDNGVMKPLNWTEADVVAKADKPGHRFMSASSASELIEVLKSAPSPAGRMPSKLTQNAPEIAFKTGTSYGFRDAWAAGVARGYAVVVWVGRADGAPRPDETGRKSALPVLFNIFDRVASELAPAGPAEDRLMSEHSSDPKFAMSRFSGRDDPPMILFPPENAVLMAKRDDHPNRGFVLAGRGEGDLNWFVNGVPVGLDPAGAPLWVPEGPGFYDLSAVDEYGRESRVAVRVQNF
ncbi:MAG: penicillin-binding protein 1C [Ponticaulis sp.]|nr:penicillin-binding protein 1C [Ponticaulis sp.]|tara:strand:- start:10758 stop:12875 length:2118 start_codon:yes stop_codon:yes gene_type:complete